MRFHYFKCLITLKMISDFCAFKLKSNTVVATRRKQLYQMKISFINRNFAKTEVGVCLSKLITYLVMICDKHKKSRNYVFHFVPRDILTLR